MHAVVLAAGYATRLRPLTNRVAKPLLPLAGRPMVDYLVDKIDEVGDVEAVHVVTNSRFAAGLRGVGVGAVGTAAGSRPRRRDDRRTTTASAPIGDLALRDRACRAGRGRPARRGGRQPLRLLASRTTSRSGARSGGSAIGVHDVGDLALARAVRRRRARRRRSGRRHSWRSPSGRPARWPRSRRTCSPAEHAGLVQQYLDEGNAPDQPGRFVVWLYPRVRSRIPLRGRVAGHRRPVAAARGRQPHATARRARRAGRVPACNRHRADTESAQTRALPPASVEGVWVSCSISSLPVRCVVCGAPSRAAVRARAARGLRRLAGPRCARCGAPTSGPSRAAVECQGRRLAFASARAAVAYDAAAKALVSAWKERGLRGLAEDAAALVAEVVPRPRAYTLDVRSAGRRPDASSAATTRPSGSRGSSARAGSCRSCRCSRGPRPAPPQRGLCARRAARGTSAAASVARGGRRRGGARRRRLHERATAAAAASALRKGGRAARRRRHVRACRSLEF